MRVLLLAFFFIFNSTSVFAAQTPIRIAIDVPYPPFAYYDAGNQLTGFDVDIAKALCAELKRECTIVIMPFEDIIPSIAANSVDMAVVGMGDTPERRKLVNFSDRYYRSHSIFVEKPGTVAGISPADLKGKRIGVQAGTIQETYLREGYKDSVIIANNLHVETFDNLKKGIVDVVLTDGLPGYTYLKSKDGEGLETIGGPITSGSLTGASFITVSKKQPELLKQLNEAIQTIRRNGEYGKINRKYFDFNVF